MAAKRRTGTKSSKNSQRISPVSSNKQKGNLVEKIAAMLHESAEVRVERNVFLPPLNGDPERKREIDVLLTSHVAGYPVRIAIECKNEGSAIGVEFIDAFVGKLDDVGIPHQHGIFIAATGYTSGALDRAKAKGIRTLILTGLTEDRLNEVISQAYQYMIYLLPVVKCLRITNSCPESSFEMLAFFNNEGELCGMVPDLIWFKWQEGQIALTLGEQDIELQIPAGWKQSIKEDPDMPTKLRATVEVVGIVLKLTGKARQHSLIDALTKQTDRTRLKVDFNLSRLRGRHLTFKHFFTEEELQAWMEKHEAHRLVNRIKLPRLQYLDQFYYPLSERVAGIVMSQLMAYDAGQLPTPPVFRFDELEGSELKNAWEPICQFHFGLWSRTHQQPKEKAE